MYFVHYKAPLTSLASKGVLKPFSLWCNQVRICWLMYYYQSLFYVTDYIMLCVVLNKIKWTELNWTESQKIKSIKWIFSSNEDVFNVFLLSLFISFLVFLYNAVSFLYYFPYVFLWDYSWKFFYFLYPTVVPIFLLSSYIPCESKQSYTYKIANYF